MNTKRMFDELTGAKLSRPRLFAHVIWSLVSQAGRHSMSVGEVCKMVRGTSGIQPSAYQVKSVMAELENMRAVLFVHGSVKGRGTEVRYEAGEAIIAALICYSYGLIDSDVHDAAIQATFSLWVVQREALQAIVKYNQELDANALDESNG